MADRSPAPDTPELRERWGALEFMSKGHTPSYTTDILGAIDVVFGEGDR